MMSRVKRSRFAATKRPALCSAMQSSAASSPGRRSSAVAPETPRSSNTPTSSTFRADAQRSRAARCAPGPRVGPRSTPGCTLRRAQGCAPHDHDGDSHPSDIHPTLAQHHQVVDTASTTTLAGAVADRPVLKFTLEHAALVAAARLQAPPPALQEVGRLPRDLGTRGSSGPGRIREVRRGLVAKDERLQGVEKVRVVLLRTRVTPEDERCPSRDLSPPLSSSP